MRQVLTTIGVVGKNLASRRLGHEATITARVCLEDGDHHTMGGTDHEDVYDGCQFTPLKISGVQVVEELRYVCTFLHQPWRLSRDFSS